MDQNRQDDAPVSAIKLTEKPLIDPETVKKAMQGDEKAFTALFTQTYRSMFFVVRRFLQRDEDIYDALQNGYLKAYKYMPRLHAPEAFVPWLKTTMENEARNVRAMYRDNELSCENMSSFLNEPASECMDSAERRADIEDVLSRLDPRQAQVLTLHYYDGMKLSEIAKMLNEPQSTVRSRFAQAKKILAEQLRVKGINKSMYGGSLSTMIAVCLRSLIGTDVLSATIAQKMLDDILRGKQSKLGAAAYKMLETQRNRTILKAVSLLMALTVAVTCVTVALLNGLRWRQLHSPGSPTTDAEDSAPPEQSLPDTAPPHESDSSEGISEANGTDSMPTENGSPAFYPSPSLRPSASTKNTTATNRTDTPSSASSDHKASDTTSSEPEFVPDYASGQANIIGNTPNNVGQNRGFVAKQADWIYFTEGNGYRVLKKMKTDGSQTQLIAEDTNGFSYINVVGDWIYYCGNGIWKIRTDGSCRELLSSRNAMCLYVDGDIGYFTLMATSNPPIFRIELSTKKTTLLQSRTSDFPITVGNGKILYCERQILKIFDIKTNQVYNTEINCEPSILINGNHVYYVDDDTVFSGDYTGAVFSPVEIGRMPGWVDEWSDERFPAIPFYISPYKGGLLGFWTSNEGQGYPSLLSLSGQSFSWPAGSLVDAGYGFYTFDDSCVYFYTQDLLLHRAICDGSNFTSFS